MPGKGDWETGPTYGTGAPDYQWMPLAAFAALGACGSADEYAKIIEQLIAEAGSAASEKTTLRAPELRGVHRRIH